MILSNIIIHFGVSNLFLRYLMKHQYKMSFFKIYLEFEDIINNIFGTFRTEISSFIIFEQVGVLKNLIPFSIIF